jgi:Tfp pilus assembly protein PilF
MSDDKICKSRRSSMTIKPYTSHNPPTALTKLIKLTKARVIMTGLSALLLAGCQSTTDPDLTGSTRYQGSAPVSNSKNLNKQEIALDGDFEQARNNYGVYLSQMKRYSEAAQQFEIAGSALGYEGRISALENLGRTYLQLNDSAAAAKAFLRALDGNRNSIVAHIELVDLLLAQNRVQQAQRLYDETLILVQGQGISPRLLLQGIKLAEAQGDSNQRQQLSRQLLSAYPLSDEAKQLKTWLNNPEAPWQ